MNITSANISLNQWLSNGCPIKSFLIRYKPMIGTNDWIEVSTDLWPEVKTISIESLSAHNWYTLWVTARTDVHNIDNTYHFATLDPLGGMYSSHYTTL